MLITLWNEEEGFSGKRPFGNSGWKWEIYTALVSAKVVDGKLDEDGYIEEVDFPEADNVGANIIFAVFKELKGGAE